MFWHFCLDLIFIWHFSLFQPADDGSRSMDQYTIRSRSRMIPKPSLILNQTNFCHWSLTWSVAVGHVRRTPNVTWPKSDTFFYCYWNEIPRNTLFECIKPGSEAAATDIFHFWSGAEDWVGRENSDPALDVITTNFFQSRIQMCDSPLIYHGKKMPRSPSEQPEFSCYDVILLQGCWRPSGCSVTFFLFFLSNQKCPLK